jgi:hypothetical protein
MAALRDIVLANGPVWLAAGGLVIGLAFGAIAMATNFCTMGGISDVLTLGDGRRLRAWLLAAATALIGAQLLHWLNVVDLSKSMYLPPRLNWFGNIAGGLMFGFGMVFAGGCASRNLVRLGSGDMRSLMALILLGVFAYITIGGILGPLRVALETATSITVPAPTQGLGDLLAPYLQWTPEAAGHAIAGLIAGVTLGYCFLNRPFRTSRMHVWSGLGVGLCVIAAWALTGLAFDEMDHRPVAPVSLTYVRPIGDALEWLQRFTGAPLPGFGTATVFGAILGAFLVARARGRFRVTGFANTGDTLRTLGGAALMGVGGVMALGCTVGQGITGVSTLALGSFLTFAAIALGGVLGVKTLERWLTV